MTGIIINRWTRYGHDRGYASDPDGNRLGWIDVNTGRVQLEDGVDASKVVTKLNEWRDLQVASGVAAVPADDAELRAEAVPSPPSESAEWTDLASNRPGHLARIRAAEEWERQKRLGTVVAVVGKLVDVHSEERAWRKGAEGEERVGAVLDRLTKRGWKILHSIRVGENSDIDHLAIGPGGVVLVNSKHHPGAKVSVGKHGIWVNGAKTDHAEQARAQARRAHELLSRAGAPTTRVQACVAIFNGNVLQPEMKKGESPAGVWVVTNWNMGSTLKRLDPVLSEGEIDAIFDVARRSTTWA